MQNVGEPLASRVRTKLLLQSEGFLFLNAKFFLLEIQLALIFLNKPFGFFGEESQLRRGRLLIVQLLRELRDGEQLFVDFALKVFHLLAQQVVLSENVFTVVVKLAKDNVQAPQRRTRAPTFRISICRSSIRCSSRARSVRLVSVAT